MNFLLGTQSGRPLPCLTDTTRSLGVCLRVAAIGDTATVWCFVDFLCAKSNQAAFTALSRTQVRTNAVNQPNLPLLIDYAQQLYSRSTVQKNYN